MAEPVASAATQRALDEGRALFNAGRHFEAHERWEAAWREEQGEVRRALQGLIQVAAGYFKGLLERNPRGAEKLLSRGLDHLDGLLPGFLGLDLDAFRPRVARDLARLRRWAGGEGGGTLARAPRLGTLTDASAGPRRRR